MQQALIIAWILLILMTVGLLSGCAASQCQLGLQDPNYQRDCVGYGQPNGPQPKRFGGTGHD